MIYMRNITITTAKSATYLENVGSNVVQDGADISYAGDNYYGVSFRAVHPDGNTYDYTMAVDTGMALINTRTLVDTTSPTVTLSSTTTTLTGTAPFTVTATFDEAVTGFNDLVNDITIANGSVTGITAVSATVYTCLLYTSPSPRDRTRSRMPSSA